MFQKNLQTYENQYDTAKYACRFLVFRSEHISDFHAQDREYEGSYTYYYYRQPNIDLNASKRNTHRQSIKAGGNSQKRHGLEIEGIAAFAFFLFAPNGFSNHVGTYQNEQTESNPMRVCINKALKLLAQKKPDDGHQGLKEAKPKATSQGQTDTENASMERPTAISNNSRKLISLVLTPLNLRFVAQK